MSENKSNENDDILLIALSFFRFYYYTIIKSDKRHEIAANPKEATILMFTPVVFIIIYPFLSSLFLSQGLAMATTFLLVPVFILNLLYSNHVSNEGYRLRQEELDRVHEEEMERIRNLNEAFEKERLRRERVRQEEKKKMMEDFFEELHRERMRQESRSRARYESYQRASVDRNKSNAIKLMSLSDNPTTEEVKKAYRRLSKIHHPDLGGSQENFIRLTRAYEYLMKTL